MAALDLTASAPNALTYASELVGATTSLTGVGIDLSHEIGFGVSNTQTRYIRYDLTNGTFTNAVAAADLVVGASTVAVVQGGAIGGNYVILQITAGADYAATQLVDFALGTVGVTVTSTASAASISYSLYETAAAAVAAGATGRLASASEAIATFGTGVDLTITPNTSTASVEALFKEFTTGSPAATEALIGTITTLGAKTGVVTPAGVQVVWTDLVAAGTKLVVEGDFGAAGSITIDNADNCATTTYTGTLNATNTSADIVLDTNTLTGQGVCYTVTGATAVPEQTVTAALDVVAAVGATTADLAAQTLGTIDHDGTTLQSPWFNAGTAYISRFVLTNTGGTDAGYTASVITEDGNVCTTGTGTTGTIGAGKQLVVLASDICTDFSGNNRGAVEFTIAAPNSTIQGVYNIVNKTTGSISVSNMMRPGTN
jgi:hypothetical protein